VRVGRHVEALRIVRDGAGHDADVVGPERVERGLDESVVALELARRGDEHDRISDLLEPGRSLGRRLPETRTDAGRSRPWT
jgi:hypothetical protein